MEYGNCQLLDRQEADQNKHEQALRKGITIIPVPFWWDFDQNRYCIPGGEYKNVSDQIDTIPFVAL